MKRPGHVFHRKLTGELPQAVSGKGCYIYADDNRRWLDASGGAVVVNLGHGRSEIADAVSAQLREGSYFHLYKAVAVGTKDGDGLVIAPPFPAGEKEFGLIGRELARAIEDVCLQ